MFNSRIAGIPCQIEITYYSPGRPARLHGPAEDCHPAEDSEFDFDVYDRKGYRAKWLENKITDEDIKRVMADAESHRINSFDPY